MPASRHLSTQPMRPLRHLAVLALAALGGLAACSTDPGVGPGPGPGPGNDGGTVPEDGGGDGVGPGPDSPAPGDGPAAPTVTYHRDVLPILQAKCQGCHIPGGVAPFPLTSYQEAKGRVESLVVATQARIMPPWPPGDDCRPLQHSRALDQAQIDVLTAWRDQGTPEGNPADAPPPPEVRQIPTPDRMAAMPERYMPDQALTDDYRCFIIDPGIDRDTHVTGYFIEPGNASLVHHVIVQAIPPEGLADAMALDAEDTRPGYECFGGLRVNGPGIGGWAPGAPPQLFPEGTGIPVTAGTRLAVQLHYNVANGPGQDDLSQVGIYLARPGQAMIDAGVYPIPKLDIAIPAGEGDWVETQTYPVPEAARIWNVSGHMHLRGSAIRLSATRGGQESCLLDIPQWDFHWQGGYDLVDYFDIAPGDTVTLTCRYDNSAANQPLGADGRPVEPTDLRWGERTTDEMCLSFVYVTTPP